MYRLRPQGCQRGRSVCGVHQLWSPATASMRSVKGSFAQGDAQVGSVLWTPILYMAHNWYVSGSRIPQAMPQPFLWGRTNVESSRNWAASSEGASSFTSTVQLRHSAAPLIAKLRLTEGSFQESGTLTQTPNSRVIVNRTPTRLPKTPNQKSCQLVECPHNVDGLMRCVWEIIQFWLLL